MPWSMHFNLIVPEFVEAPRAAYYRAMLDIAKFADVHGCDNISVAEHHQTTDGYMPDTLTVAAALAAVTETVPIRLTALILSLHDPVSAAERTILVDLLSNGRLEVVLGAGYIRKEFEMFGLTVSDRARLMEEKLPIYIAALSGEPFEYNGTTVQITPRPAQNPRPRVLLGGTVAAVARRAARLADGFNPIINDPQLARIYEDECARLGKEPGMVMGGGQITPWTFLSEDIDAEWERLAPYLTAETNAYGSWAAEAGTNEHLYKPVENLAQLKGMGMYQVISPDECVELLNSGKHVPLHPLCGGTPPEIAWQHLNLLVGKVLPFVSKTGKQAGQTATAR